MTFKDKLGIEYEVRDFTKDGAVCRFKKPHDDHFTFIFISNDKLEFVYDIKNPISGDYENNRVARSVKCIETGTIYDSQNQACIDLELTPAALSHHLKGRTGYKTVGGYTFELTLPAETTT